MLYGLLNIGQSALNASQAWISVTPATTLPMRIPKATRASMWTSATPAA